MTRTEKIDTNTGEIVPVPHTFADVQDMAGAIVRGGLFPQFKTPEQALSLMLLCQAKGLHPMTAVERYDVIQGRPAMKTSYLLAEFKSRGGRVQWHADPTDDHVAGTFISPSGDCIEVVWTKERAIKAKLYNKEGPWQMYPQQMLRARCISEAVRAIAPECLHGLYTTEEVADMPPLPPINVTPHRESMTTAKALPAAPERSGNGRDLIPQAKAAFGDMAQRLGVSWDNAYERGELVNQILGRPKDDRSGFSVGDWNKATANLGFYLARQNEVAVSAAEEDHSEPVADVKPATAADAAIENDPFETNETQPTPTQNYAQAELAASGGKKGGR